MREETYGRTQVNSYLFRISKSNCLGKDLAENQGDISDKSDYNHDRYGIRPVGVISPLTGIGERSEPNVKPLTAPVRIPTMVIPTWVVDRNRSGYSADRLRMTLRCFLFLLSPIEGLPQQNHSRFEHGKHPVKQ